MFLAILGFPFNLLKAVYYTVVVHNFNLQEKTTSTVEVTTNFFRNSKIVHGKANDLCM